MTQYSFDQETLRERKAPVKESSKETLDTEEGELFECNVCLDTASEPVVTMCGHLYCWSCLHQWMSTNVPQSNACPVCKSAIDNDKIIPIFVRGREPKDPRKEIPKRPQAQRTQPQPQFQLGLGIFPFFPVIQVGLGQNAPPNEIQAFLSRVFLMMATLVLVAIMFY